MKRRLDELFDTVAADELDVLMENTDLSATLDAETLARIEKQTLEKCGVTAPKMKKRVVKKALLLAATFALLFAFMLGAVACAAEQKEYREALKFFEEYNLSTEGLSRGEIKKVYRDITLRRFTYSKTAEVIEKSVWTQRLEGVEILPNDPTPEEVAELWQAFKDYIGNYTSILRSNDTEYRTRTGYITDEYGNLRADSYYIEKFNQEQMCWSVELEGGVLDTYLLSDGVLVNCLLESVELRDMWRCLFKISNQGEIVWRYDYDDFFEACYENTDGTISVLSSEIHPDQRYLIVRTFSAGGELLQSHKNEVNGGIRSVSRGENGYLLVLSQGVLEPTGPTYGISRVDLTGKEIESFFCSSDMDVYEINNVIEYGGRIYFSANVKSNDDEYELSDVLAYAREKWNKEGSSYTDEMLLQMIRECYTATLMVCDPISGEPKEFYTQKGAFGSGLAIDENGSLIWCVEGILSAVFQPYLNSCQINGLCYVYQYAFDTEGEFLGQVQTALVVPYMR